MNSTMITSQDGTQIYFKGWGPKNAKPIVFHHGWRLCSDDWDTQMLHFVAKGCRVVAHDRRGHGRSSQISDGHDMDHHVAEHLDLRDAIHISQSTGGATRYVARHGKGRVARLALIGAVSPIMIRRWSIRAACRSRSSMACDPRSPPTVRFYLDIARGPFLRPALPGICA